MLQANKFSKKKSDSMAAALCDVKSGHVSYGAASKLYNIPKTTIYRHHKHPDLKKQGRPPVFGEEFERELAQHVKTFDDQLFGLNVLDVQKLAYQMAVRNGIPHRFNNETQMAGRRWIAGFFSRPPGAELAIRQPECLSMNRFKSFTKINCDHFFDIMGNLVDLHQFDASSIYNMDETGFSTVQKKAVRIISSKGKRRVSTLSSGERGVNTTVVCCVNAAGDWHVKPFIIFKGARITQDHAIGLIEGRLFRNCPMNQ
jgi:hypothetical protein